MEAALAPPINGCILLTYGSGNLQNDEGIQRAITNASERVIMVNVSQCMDGTVVPTYQAGIFLYDAGVLAGHDITLEAALAKLQYVLGQDHLDFNAKRAVSLRSTILYLLMILKDSYESVKYFL